jgi:hypothetical protein
MAGKNNKTDFKWDIAISLCKQDVEFARKLVRAINPSLKVFFYEDRQEELISKSGPEAFAKIFLNDCRVVVILSREEWSNSFYTEIERNAIIDRTAVKNEGYHFLMVIPMVRGEIPPWYPTTKIYASPERFTIVKIAQFIEFKVADQGGVIRKITFEEQFENLKRRIEEKKSLIKLQTQNIAIESAKAEIKLVKEIFQNKMNLFITDRAEKINWFQFSEHVHQSYIEFDGYHLQCTLGLPDFTFSKLVSTQDYSLEFILSETNGHLGTGNVIKREKRVYYSSQEETGWALPLIVEEPTEKEYQALFHNTLKTQYYDLKKRMQTQHLIDLWFQRLLFVTNAGVKRFI